MYRSKIRVGLGYNVYEMLSNIEWKENSRWYLKGTTKSVAGGRSSWLSTFLDTLLDQLVLGTVFARIVLRVLQTNAGLAEDTPRFLACDGLLGVVSGLAKAGDGSAMQWLPGSVSHPLWWHSCTLDIRHAQDGVHLETGHGGYNIGPAPRGLPGLRPRIMRASVGHFDGDPRGSDLGRPWGGDKCSVRCRPGHTWYKKLEKVGYITPYRVLALISHYRQPGLHDIHHSNLERPAALTNRSSVLSYCTSYLRILLYFGQN